MKSILFAFVLFSVSLAWSKQLPIDTEQSRLEWLGQKRVPGGDHNGTVRLKSGTVNMDKGKLTGGTLVINMQSIENSDLSGNYKKKLEAHLQSADFFDVANNPEATFKITKIEPKENNTYKVTGNLTLRGKTNTETFDVKVDKKSVKNKDGKKIMVWVATGDIQFDRNRYGVTYNSEANFLKKVAKIAADKVIKDQIKLTLNLQTTSI